MFLFFFNYLRLGSNTLDLYLIVRYFGWLREEFLTTNIISNKIFLAGKGLRLSILLLFLRRRQDDV